MDAVVLSIGTELIDGHLSDTNATFLARGLAALGIPLRWVAQVGDDLDWIVRMLRRAWEDASLIVTTGGIGPTEDDLTREAIAQLLAEPLTIDPALLEEIRAFFAARGLTMPERNAKQASRIPSCEPLPNPIGTAPGWFVRRDGHTIVTMPGVPREMTRMWHEQAVPRLLPSIGGGAIRFRTLKTIGLGESLVEERIHDLIATSRARIATYAKDDGVHVRITAHAADAGAAERLLDEVERSLRARLGSAVYGTDDTTLGGAILELLGRSGWTLAITEWASGSRLTSLMAEEPAAGQFLRTATILTSQPPLDSSLEEVARDLAQRTAVAAGSDCGLAIIVRIDPGPTADRSEGQAVLAVSTPATVVTRTHEITSHPQEIRRRVGLWAAEFLLLALLEASIQESTATSA